MKGFIPRTALGLGLSLLTLAGCACYREVVDPCWPERYNWQARQSINEVMNAQANNGHILDQTIWNYHFDKNTDKLNAAGMEHLKYLSRRRPAPDARIYIATAQDLPVEEVSNRRGDLNNSRIKAVQQFLALQTNGQGMFAIEVHDPAEVGIAALPIVGSPAQGPGREVIGGYQKLFDNFQGALQTTSGSSGAGVSGGSSSSSSGSSSSGSSSSGGGSPPR